MSDATLAWEGALRLLSSGAVGAPGADTEQPEPVVCLCHVGPDGDALGSMLGLALALDRLGVPVRCSWGDDPVEIPATYWYLPGSHLVVDHAMLPAAPRVVVTLDTSSRDRLGRLEPLLERAEAVLVIDHHASNTRFGSHLLLDPAAAATAVLVAELVERLGVPLDAEIATCLYTGLTTDTGSFKFAATTPSVHGLAARLLATGIRHDLIARAIWDTRPFGYLRVLGAALERARLEPAEVGGRGLVWTATCAADLRAAGIGLEQVEGVIDVLRTAEEAEVAAVVKEAPDGRLLVSLRSKGAVDVGALAVGLGGGGHRYAAGYTASGDLAATVTQLRERLGALPS